MKYIIPILMIVLILGCQQIVTDPFSTNYTPVVSDNFSSADKALTRVIAILKSNGYEVTGNDVILTATTEPRNTGYQIWKVTNEKWKVSYKIGVQLIRASEHRLYWKMSHKIVGSRQGKHDREFAPYDFEITENEFNKINHDLTNALSMKQ